MHNAPSVTYPVGRCAFQRWVWLGCLAASFALLALWAWQQAVGVAGAVAGLLLILAVSFGWREGKSADGDAPAGAITSTITSTITSGITGRLHWSGRAWQWQPHDAHRAQDGDVRVVLDAQTTLLLHWQPLSATLGAGRWLWLTRDQRPTDWQHLRRAVYGPR